MQPEAERPYHIQAIYDLRADYSPEHFRFAIGECRKIISRVIAEDNSSDQQIAREKILVPELQLLRALRWIDEEADFLAVVLRSQMELRSGPSMFLLVLTKPPHFSTK